MDRELLGLGLTYYQWPIPRACRWGPERPALSPSPPLFGGLSSLSLSLSPQLHCRARGTDKHIIDQAGPQRSEGESGGGGGGRGRKGAGGGQEGSVGGGAGRGGTSSVRGRASGPAGAGQRTGTGHGGGWGLGKGEERWMVLWCSQQGVETWGVGGWRGRVFQWRREGLSGQRALAVLGLPGRLARGERSRGWFWSSRRPQASDETLLLCRCMDSSDCSWAEKGK